MTKEGQNMSKSVYESQMTSTEMVRRDSDFIFKKKPAEEESNIMDDSVSSDDIMNGLGSKRASVKQGPGTEDASQSFKS